MQIQNIYCSMMIYFCKIPHSELFSFIQGYIVMGIER